MLDQSEWPVCNCKPENPCNSDSDCLNRVIYFECNPKTCPTGDACKNRRIQKSDYAKTKSFKCSWGGWGLKTEQGMNSFLKYKVMVYLRSFLIPYV